LIRGAVLGADVGRSRSPVIHRAAFAALGLDGTYEAISVDDRGFAPLVRRLGREGFRYVNVTIPHKLRAARMAHERSPAVRAAGAANTLVFTRGARGAVRIAAHNTDGDGVVAALADLGVKLGRGTTIVLVGAGGAAAGALLSFVNAGAHVHLLARRPEAARALRRRFAPPLRARIDVASWTATELAARVARANVLVSAVPAAAWEDREARAGLAALPRGAAVLDMAYGAKASPLARAVRRKTARYQDGLPMLVHQARRAVQLALGRRPPVDPMLRAARRG
jgi:shikimate dehydrogenase